jgi:NAD(P)H-flavin reductase
MHAGEEPDACAVREVEEELGIEIEILGLLLRRPYDYADRRVDIWFYVARRLSGEPRAIGCSECRWVDPGELAAYPLPDASEPVLAALQKGGWLDGDPGTSRARTATVLSNRPLSGSVVEIVLRPDDPRGESFHAGQHWILSLSARERSAFSIATPPSLRNEIGFCIQTEGGSAARAIARLRPGARIRYTGPHGAFTLRAESPRDPIMVGMGTGIAPLRSMILELIARGSRRRIDLVFGARTPEELLYGDEFRRLESEQAGFRYHPCLTRPPVRGWNGDVGRVTDRLASVLPDTGGREAYLCGSREMVLGSIERLVARGIDRSLCFHEEWG